MSYLNFEKAMFMARKIEFYRSAGKQSVELIDKVENVLDIKLSQQNREYYSDYGYIMFKGFEFYGIYKGVFEGIYNANAVVATLQDRIEYKLPLSWIPILDMDDGYKAYLDYANTNAEDEPRVILGIYTGENYEVEEVLADDLGDFILQLVEEQLSNQ